MQLTCDDEEGTVTVDGVTIAGRVCRDLSCPACGGPIVFYESYDTNICARCNVWLEEEPHRCQAPKCEFCERFRPLPPTPLPFLRS